MRIVHVGPRLTRTGGPAGYLRELARVSAAHASDRHDVWFPAPAEPRSPSPPPSPLYQALRQAKRAVLGTPMQHRPSHSEVRTHGGPLAELLATSQENAVRTTMPHLLEHGALDRADVLFVHDPLVVPAVLEHARDADVWLMVHSPMPMALYYAWNWGVPEERWQDVVTFPDVRDGLDAELSSWRRVDRLVFPCEEAVHELTRADARFGDVATPRELILTGSNARATSSDDASRRRWQLPDDEVVGLFLGNSLAYRGLDALIDALDHVTTPTGVIAIAGPDAAAIPSHPRLRALGRVDDVPALLATVDFLVNTNRFSLFDLSNIEGAAAGKALLLHDVGGNRTLHELGAGCRRIDSLTPQAVANGLDEMFLQSRDALAELGKESKTCYDRHLTADRMWERHLKTYDAAEAGRPARELRAVDA